MAHGNAYAQTARRQRAHDMAPDKARAIKTVTCLMSMDPHSGRGAGPEGV
jgi:hypothetical protein